MTSWEVVWAALAACLGAVLSVIAAVEGWTITNDERDDTISETTRRRFQVHTPRGKASFIAAMVTAWSLLSAAVVWFIPHVLG